MKKLLAMILIFLLSYAYGGVIKIYGDEYSWIGTTGYEGSANGYSINAPQENGNTPTEFSNDGYVVLGNNRDSEDGLGDYRGLAYYLLEGLPSADPVDYTSMDLIVKWYTSDAKLENGFDTENSFELAYAFSESEDNSTGSFTINNRYEYMTSAFTNLMGNLSSYGGGRGRFGLDLISSDEIAIGYIQATYQVVNRLEMGSVTWNSNVTYTGGTYQIQLSNNDASKSINWTASDVPDWANLDISGGTLSNGDPQTVNITISQNSDEENSRSATIKFYNSFITEDSVSITISQEEDQRKSTISGRITNNSGNLGISDVKILLSYDESGFDHELIDSTMTSEDGQYSFTKLLSGHYKVQPEYEGHDFDPDYETITLTNENRSNVDFTDQTTIGVSGRITFEGYDCPIEGVVIKKQVPDEEALDFATSDSSGYWSGYVDIGEEFRLIPQKGDLEFSPTAYPSSDYIYLLENTDTIDFNVTTTKSLTLKAQKNNGDPIQNVNMIVRSTHSSIPEISAFTDNSGKAVFDIPPLSYQIHPISDIYRGWYPEDTIDVDLACDTTLTFNPITDIILHVFDIPFAYNADSTDSIMAIHQEDSSLIYIQICDTDGYPVNSGTIDISDFVCSTDGAAQNATITADSNGIAEYFLIGGEPEYHSADHLKSITFSAARPSYTENAQNTLTVDIAVTGEKLVTEAFTTGLPEIPLKILHDPSGDNSYTYYIEESKLTQSIGLSIETSTGQEVKAKTGWKIFGIGASVTGALKTTLSLSSNTAWDITYSEKDVKSSSKSTSNASSIGPGKGDVYVGIGMNILYGLGEVIEIVDAVPRLDTNFFWQPNLNAATYMYTANYIENTILKQDCDRLPFYENEDWQYDPVDSRERWENVLHMNIGYDNQITEDEDSLVHEIDAISFNGGTSTDHDYTVTRSMQTNLKTKMNFNHEIATALSFGGSEASYTVNISLGIGASYSVAETRTETIGYHLQDDDEYDAINMKCYQDLVFGTLLFISENSVTSNPWEKQTSCLMGVELNPSGDVAAGLRTNETATFWADVCNTNFNQNVPGSYTVYAPSNLNPTHATVRINSKSSDNIIVPHGGSYEIGITAEYGVSTIGDTSVFAVVAQAMNDWQIADTLYYTIYWDHVVPLVEFMSDQDPYGNTINDTITDLGLSVMVWGEPRVNEDPDSVILYSRLEGNYIWDRVGKMTEYKLEGATHNYFAFEYLADSESDTCILEFEMEAYKNDRTRNSTGRHYISIIPQNISGINDNDPVLPDEFSLAQNYPNPFNPYTTIRYAIPQPSGVRISIYDISGALIRTLIEEDHAPGVYDLQINASNLSSGLYIYRLQANDHVLTKKMLLMK